jgi:hypothetical protein
LDGTSRYREQHKIVDQAAKKLEGEIGRLAEAASKCVRGIVSRLSCGLDVQQLVREALEAADLLQAPSENADVISQSTGSRPSFSMFQVQVGDEKLSEESWSWEGAYVMTSTFQ